VPLSDADGEGDAATETVRDAEFEAQGVGDPLKDCDALALGDRVGLTVKLGDGVPLRERVGDTLDDGQRDEEAVTDTV